MPPARPALPLPTLVAHADWGSQSEKRWIATARRQAGGWRVEAPVHVDAPTRLLARLRDEAGEGGAALVGFDFPIGLPLAYARRAHVRDFRALLPALGGAFFEVAERPEEISLLRPFYPMRPGGAAQGQLALALGVDSFDDLRRVCERARPGRAAAAPLFWTLGAQQVGKAAIAGWREVLIPALRSGAQDVALWPFEGALAELFAPGRVVIAETYPAEFYTHLGVEFTRPPEGGSWGKRQPKERAAQAGVLLAAARRLEAALAPELEQQLRDGFAACKGRGGDDPFDASVGVLGMLQVVAGLRAAGEPADPEVRRIEGWILGQRPAEPGV